MAVTEYRTVDKSEWGEGKFQTEPDKISWTDEATGFPCLIVRSPSGALCGYVGVSKNHPFYMVEYNERNQSWRKGSFRITFREEGKQAPEDLVDVHGGLTFSGKCQHGDDPSKGICHIPAPGEPDDVWWLGFDCAHAGDYSPASEMRLRSIFPPEDWAEHQRVLGLGQPTGWGGVIEYRDVTYVRQEVASLTAQLKAVELRQAA